MHETRLLGLLASERNFDNLELRYYQKEAIEAVLKVLKDPNGGNPCVEIPTGGGKTPIIASLCARLVKDNARVLCVAHRKELLEQTVDKLKLWARGVRYTIVSAGLNQRNYKGDVVVAGIHSVYRNAGMLAIYGKIDYVIVDEAHLIPSVEENAKGMYQTLLKDLKSRNPKLRVIGLTATPYRLKSGFVCGKGKILTKICYSVSVLELIKKGYLSPLVSRVSSTSVGKVDFSIVRGEFKASEVDEVYNTSKVVSEAVAKIVEITKHKKKVLIFCCSIGHCRAVANALKRACTDEVGVVLGDTDPEERESILRRFKEEYKPSSSFRSSERPVKYLCNVEVLTLGFDAPNIDCIVLLRPTASPGLYYQMCGRGFRICNNKRDCLIVDFADNIERFGPIDQLTAPTPKRSMYRDSEIMPSRASLDFNLCPRCYERNDPRVYFCVGCEFQLKEFAKHDGDFDNINPVMSASFGPLLTNRADERDSDLFAGVIDNLQPTNKGNKKDSNRAAKVSDAEEIIETIIGIRYFVGVAKYTGKSFLRVQYKTSSRILLEDVLFEEARDIDRQRTLNWWRTRTDRPVPSTANEAHRIVTSPGFAQPKKVKYRLTKNADKESCKLLFLYFLQKDVPESSAVSTQAPLSSTSAPSVPKSAPLSSTSAPSVPKSAPRSSASATSVPKPAPRSSAPPLRSSFIKKVFRAFFGN